MLKARKANRVVKIPDDKKDAYLALGYTISDMNDKPIAEPHNAEKEAADLKEKVSSLEAKLKEAAEYAEKADAKIADLEAKLKEAAVKKAAPVSTKAATEAAKQAASTQQDNK